MKKYYESIEQAKKGTSKLTGGLFFAVCRGKVSEGIDFVDENARAVVIFFFLDYPLIYFFFSEILIQHVRL